ncbi:MAG: RNA polymerase sigma factor [Bacteroidales bacterium]|nr:RNA polymerase sigma factor [Bacteroidales bacterium]
MRKDISDEFILEEFKKSRDQGFRLLFDKYHERIYFHIRRIVILHHDADDAFQNTFMKIWNNLNKFRKESSLYTWLYRIASNEAIAMLKKRKSDTGLSLESLSDFFKSSEEGDKWFDGDEAERKLRDAILKLPDKQKLVFNLKYYEDMRYEDMSKVLNTSVGALKASYHHAVRKIEEYLTSI